MGAIDFFEARGVFTADELAASDPTRSRKAVENLIRYHLDRRHIFRLRYGIYEVLDHHEPILAASKIAPDAVLAYDTALHLHRRDEPLWVGLDRVSVLTRARRSRFRYGDPDFGVEIVPMRPAAPLGVTWNSQVKELQHCGHPVRVTTLERTLVDLLDRIELSPPAETLWRWFAHNALDVDVMVHWARKLKSALAAARLGFFLSCLPCASTAQIARLPRLTSTAYFDRKRRPWGNAYHRDWKLLLPLRVWLMAERTDFRYAPARIPSDDQLPP